MSDMSDVTVPENPEPDDAEDVQDSEAGEEAGGVVMLRSSLMVMMLRRSLRNSFSPGC